MAAADSTLGIYAFAWGRGRRVCMMHHVGNNVYIYSSEALEANVALRSQHVSCLVPTKVKAHTTALIEHSLSLDLVAWPHGTMNPSSMGLPEAEP